MRTNIVIDDALIAETLKATGLKTKREAVELGLKTLLKLRQQAAIRDLRGKLTWEGDLDALRSDELMDLNFANEALTATGDEVDRAVPKRIRTEIRQEKSEEFGS